MGLLKWDVDYIISDEDEQQFTCDINYNELHNKFTITFVYAKCKDHFRRPLWEKLLQQDSGNNNTWCIVSDFNIITS